MYVIKRDGRREAVSLDKITERIKALVFGLDEKWVDPMNVSKPVCAGVHKGVTTMELDNLAAETAAQLTCIHPDYGFLAARIAVSNLHKSTNKVFSEVVTALYTYVDPRTGKPAPMIHDDVYRFIQQHAPELNAAIIYKRDYLYDYFGFKTLERGYLLRIKGEIAERPQHMLMRVSCGIHTTPGENGGPATFDLQAAIETYHLMSQKWFTHATPTLFNGGTRFPQLSSCFLLSMKDDSIEGIYDTLKNCAMVSKMAGGIGVSVSNIRATGSYIRGTNGISNGLIPMLRVFNATARYVDQCFDGTTSVVTDRGLVRFRELRTTDRVLSQHGKWSHIDVVLRHKLTNPEVLQFHHDCAASRLCHVKVTPEHQLLAYRPPAQVRGSITAGELRERLDKGGSALMHDAKDLDVGDFIVFCPPDDSNRVDIPTLSYADCWFYGVAIGHAFCNQEDGMVRMHLPKNTANPRLHKELRDYLEKTRPVLFQIQEDERHICYSFSAYSPGFKFTPQEIEMRNPSMLNLPIHQVRAVLRGFLSALDAAEVEPDPDNEFKCRVHMARVQDRYVWTLFFVGGHMLSACPSAPGKMYAPALDALNLPELVYESSFPLLHVGKFYVPITRVTLEEMEGEQVFYDLELDKDSDHTYTTELGVCHNGGGKRKGAFAIYLEPWHADIFAFLELKKNHGAEEERARDLFYALWIPDLFMKRVEEDRPWSLFCPNEAPGLYDSHSEEFERRYMAYENTPGKARKVVRAREVWNAILYAQMESGTPYQLYKDAANRKSNQKNLGTIRCSNLCCEVVEYTSPDEVAVCNLMSLALPMYVKKDGAFDFDKLYEVTQVGVRNLNKIIRGNYYPIKEAERSNLRHRPVGIGVQGLADAFILMRLPFDSPQAMQLNKDIFECIYFAALSASKDLAKVHGSYSSYAGSPISQGLFQWNLWNLPESKLSGRWDWAALREEILKYGVRNSLLIAPMPTASTSQILGNNEAIEPYTSNIYVRRTLAGEFVVVCRHLLHDLIERNLWSYELKQKLIAHNGSVQNIEEIPTDLKVLYRTVWEIPQKNIIDMAADRGVFVDQSQSLNIHMKDANYAKLTSMHFHGWKRGLKTGMYYLRTKPATDAIKVSVDPKIEQDVRRIMCEVETGESVPPVANTRQVSDSKSEEDDMEAIAKLQKETMLHTEQKQRSMDEISCSLDNPEACLSCGS